MQRLLDDASLQRAFGALHECGPRSNALFIAELLDNIGADPATLDAVRTWRRDVTPEVIAAIGGEWPPTRLHAVEPLT